VRDQFLRSPIGSTKPDSNRRPLGDPVETGVYRNR
jgi:hypothetical protein